MSKTTKIIISVVVIALLAWAVGKFISNNFDNNKTNEQVDVSKKTQNQTINHVSQKEEQAKAGWKTYRDEKNGFEIQYPQDWEFRPQKGQFGFDLYKKNDLVSGLLGSERHITLSPILNDILSESEMMTQKEDWKQEINKNGTISFGQIRSLEKVNKDTEYVLDKVFTFSNGETLYSLDTRWLLVGEEDPDSPEKTIDKEAEVAIIQEILSTFKFLNKS